MRHYFKRRGGKRKVFGQPIQHSPSLMGNGPANNIGLVHVLAHASNLAGASMAASRTGGEDRSTEVDNGRHVGNTTIDFAITISGAPKGYYEYAVVKYERSFSVPTIGADPVPSSADMAAFGLQQAVRNLAPGYVLQFGVIPLTTETSTVRKIRISWSKFKKAQVRDGDYFCILFFNRSESASIYDLQIRYKTYTVK